MYTLSSEQKALYHDLVTDYLQNTLIDAITNGGGYLTIRRQDTHESLDLVTVMYADIACAITGVFNSMAYEYAELKSAEELDDTAISKHLHQTYETFVINTFINYGIGFYEEVINTFLGCALAELPYLYALAISDTLDDAEELLGDQMDAYAIYLEENYQENEESDEFDD